MRAISFAARDRVPECIPQNLTNLAQSFTTFATNDLPLLQVGRWAKPQKLKLNRSDLEYKRRI